jgi:epoxyqueuosine reductase
MESRIRGEIARFTSTTPYFDTPLAGFASASDPLFRQYKAIIGDFHLTPGEFFAKAFGTDLEAGTVICWILPVSEQGRRSNRDETRLPSLDWARVRTHGESFNNKLRKHLVTLLEGFGHRAIAPVLSAEWKQCDSVPAGIASSWSERHAAFAAGLGTFSLNDGLITEKGIAHRCGSVITDLVMPATPRSYSGHADNCLYYRDGSCADCVKRCPAGAISAGGHDKTRCRQYCNETIPAEAGGRYNVKVLGCGLCQAGVPCENGIPRPRTKKRPGS